MSVPKLRFKEFKGKWEEKKLGEITKWSSGGTPSKDKPEFWNGNIPWISASSMHGTYYQDSDLKITQEGLKNGSRLAQKDDILLLVRGSILFKRIPVGLAIRDVAFNQDVKSIKILNEVKPQFILYWFQASENKILGMVGGTGIGAGKLETSILQAVNLGIPHQNEQTKITDFLMAVDEKIVQLTQKCELLARYKKGVMQQIFSQELRFKDDDGRDFPDWEERSLSEISELITKGTTPTSLGYQFQDFGINFIKIEAITDEGNLLREKLTFIDEDTHQKLKRSQLKQNDILFSIAGALGRILIVKNDYLPANINQALALIRLSKNKNIKVEFICLYLKSDNVKKMIESTSSQLAQANLSLKNIADILSPLPNIKEQIKIANFLTSIDEKITEAQTYLDTVKQYKQGLLQQMFV